jgi:hypothetical protein
MIRGSIGLHDRGETLREGGDISGPTRSVAREKQILVDDTGGAARRRKQARDRQVLKVDVRFSAA